MEWLEAADWDLEKSLLLSQGAFVARVPVSSIRLGAESTAILGN